MTDMTLFPGLQYVDASNSQKGVIYNPDFSLRNSDNGGRCWGARANSACENLTETSAISQLMKGLSGVAACLNTVSLMTRGQKHVLGIPTDSTIPQISFLNGEQFSEVETAPTRKGGSALLASSGTGNASCEDPACKVLDGLLWGQNEMNMDVTPRRGLRKEDGTKQHLVESGLYSSVQESFSFERENFCRLLNEAENEIDDLKYAHEHRVRLLQDKIAVYRDMIIQLRDAENARQLESISAAEKLACCEGEIMVLRNTISALIEKESSSKIGKESVEKSGELQMQHMKDELATAARINTIPLENTGRCDLVYCTAIKEINNLRNQVNEARAETARQEKIHEKKIKSMEIGLLSLQPLRERVSILEKKLLKCAQNEKHMMMKYEGEMKKLQSALTRANDLVLTLKREYAALSMKVLQTGTAGADAPTQCEAMVRSDTIAGATGGLGVAGNLTNVADSEREVERLKSECDKLRNALEVMKQVHKIETEFLTARLIKAGYGVQAYPPQRSICVLGGESLVSSDAAPQAIPSGGDAISVLWESLAGSNIDDSVVLRPPVFADLSPRVKNRCGDTETWASFDESVMRPQGKASRGVIARNS